MAGVEGYLVLIGEEEALALDNYHIIKEQTIGDVTAITIFVSTFFVMAILIIIYYNSMNSSWWSHSVEFLSHNATAAVEEEEEEEVKLEEDGLVELECVVCLCHVNRGERYRVLSECKHGFHVDCINGWLKDHPTCPLCRTPVTHIPDPLLHQDDDDDQYFCGVLVGYIVSFWENFCGWLVNPLSSDFMSALCQDSNYL